VWSKFFLFAAISSILKKFLALCSTQPTILPMPHSSGAQTPSPCLFQKSLTQSFPASFFSLFSLWLMLFKSAHSTPISLSVHQTLHPYPGSLSQSSCSVSTVKTSWTFQVKWEFYHESRTDKVSMAVINYKISLATTSTLIWPMPAITIWTTTQ
jgi:hypothetical protein